MFVKLYFWMKPFRGKALSGIYIKDNHSDFSKYNSLLRHQ